MGKLEELKIEDLIDHDMTIAVIIIIITLMWCFLQ